MTLIVVAVLALVVGAILGVKVIAPKPQPPLPPPPPGPKRFGLYEVEAVKGQLGSLSPADGKTIRVAVAVGGIEWRYPDEVKAARETLAFTVADNEATIQDLKVQIAEAETSTAKALARDAEVAETAAAFGL